MTAPGHTNPNTIAALLADLEYKWGGMTPKEQGAFLAGVTAALLCLSGCQSGEEHVERRRQITDAVWELTAGTAPERP